MAKAVAKSTILSSHTTLLHQGMIIAVRSSDCAGITYASRSLGPSQVAIGITIKSSRSFITSADFRRYVIF